jgi:hypothetical protein
MAPLDYWCTLTAGCCGRPIAGGYAYKRVQTGGSDKFRDAPDKNGFSHVAGSLQYRLVGGGEARLLAKRAHRGPRSGLAVMA